MKNVDQARRRNRERTIIFILVALLLLPPATTLVKMCLAWRVNFEFNGVKWGDSIENYPDMVEFWAWDNRAIVVYRRSGERCTSPFTSVEPNEVYYAFLYGKFRAAAAFSPRFVENTEDRLVKEIAGKYGYPHSFFMTMAQFFDGIPFPLLEYTGNYRWRYPIVNIRYYGPPGSTYTFLIYDRVRGEPARGSWFPYHGQPESPDPP